MTYRLRALCISTLTVALTSAPLMLGGCSKSGDEKNAPSTKAATSAAAPTGITSASSGQLGPANAKLSATEKEILEVTQKWNDALAKRDANALESVYASKVRLYESNVARAAAIKTKATALGAAKDYTQSISNVEVDGPTTEHPKALFDKKWTQGGKEKSVRGSLVFTKENGHWMISEESDAKTDERREQAEKNKDSCEALVIAAVMNTEEGKRLLAGPTNAKGGHASNGLRLGGGPPEEPKYAVAIHENHSDHLATLAWFEVDPKTGVVTEQLDEDKALTVTDPAIVPRLKAACAKK